MEKKNRKKGFTLVELLAVIVVLAVIMVLAVPSVLNQMNSAKQKTFQMYGERMVNNAMQAYESQLLLGTTSFTNHYKEGTDTYNCYTLTELGLAKNENSFKGFVVVKNSTLINDNSANSTTYLVYLTDGSYYYEGTDSNDVINSVSNVKKIESGDKLADLEAKMVKCTN